MIDTIYVENAVARHERAENMIRRFPDAAYVPRVPWVPDLGVGP